MPAPPPGSRRQPRVTPGSCSSAVGDARGAHGRSTSLSASPRHRRRVQTERRSKYPSRPGGVRFALHLRVSPCVSPGPLSRQPGASHCQPYCIHTYACTDATRTGRRPWPVGRRRARNADRDRGTGRNERAPPASFERDTRGGARGLQGFTFSVFNSHTPREGQPTTRRTVGRKINRERGCCCCCVCIRQIPPARVSCLTKTPIVFESLCPTFWIMFETPNDSPKHATAPARSLHNRQVSNACGRRTCRQIACGRHACRRNACGRHACGWHACGRHTCAMAPALAIAC